MRTLAVLLPIVAIVSCAAPEVAPRAKGRQTATRDDDATGAGRDGDGARHHDESAPRANPDTPECRAETERLQRALDGAHASRSDAAVAVKTRSCGLRVLTSGPRNIAPSDLHRIASISKTYVAAATLDLARDGLLRLDDPASKWVAGVPRGGEITIRQLLNHTSGLFEYFFLPGYDVSEPVTPGRLLACAAEQEPYSAPGREFHYSNTNYAVLGMIVEAVTKKKLGAVIRERILRPLELDSTFYLVDETPAAPVATPRDENGKDVSNVWHPTVCGAAGAMVASPADTALWIEALGSGRFLGETLQRELLTTVETSPAAGYGLGINVYDASITGGAGPAIGHAGEHRGCRSEAWHYPETGTTIVASIDAPEDGNEVVAAILRVLFSG